MSPPLKVFPLCTLWIRLQWNLPKPTLFGLNWLTQSKKLGTPKHSSHRHQSSLCPTCPACTLPWALSEPAIELCRVFLCGKTLSSISLVVSCWTSAHCPTLALFNKCQCNKVTAMYQYFTPQFAYSSHGHSGCFAHCGCCAQWCCEHAFMCTCVVPAFSCFGYILRSGIVRLYKTIFNFLRNHSRSTTLYSTRF